MPRLLVSLVALLVSLVGLSHAQVTEVDCPDSSLTTYLLALLDTLYSNGLTHYETLLAAISESDAGYELLESWYITDSITLFVPTDWAFQNAGLAPPFWSMGVDELTNVVAFHTVEGYHGYSSLPQSPNKGTPATLLSVPHYLNSSVSSDAFEPLVLQQGDSQAISIRLGTGNATTWGWEIAGTDEIDNIVIIPVGTLLPFPPELSEALSLATTSRSTSGLPKFQGALNAVGGAKQLEALTPSGFTIFAPVDDAFTSNVETALGDSSVATRILGNHYTTNYSLFSPSWVNGGTFKLPVVSGETLVINYQDGAATITMGNVTVNILRSDITLANGVMHIIDGVFADSETLTASRAPTGSSATSGSSSKTSGTSASVSNSTGSQKDTTAGASSSAGRSVGTAASVLVGSVLVSLVLVA